MADNITPLDLAKRLAEGVRCGACGGKGEFRDPYYDGVNITRCQTCTGEGVERYPQFAECPQWVWEDVTVGPLTSHTLTAGYNPPLANQIAAPYVTGAILWLLGTEAWRAKFGRCTLEQSDNGAAWLNTRGGEPIGSRFRGTPIDLLPAMMEALT